METMVMETAWGVLQPCIQDGSELPKKYNPGEKYRNLSWTVVHFWKNYRSWVSVSGASGLATAVIGVLVFTRH